MHRSIDWKQIIEDGIKAEMRVTFPGQDRIRWQRKDPRKESWEYDFTPEPGDWAALLERAEARYSRGGIPFNRLQAIRRAAGRQS